MLSGCLSRGQSWQWDSRRERTRLGQRLHRWQLGYCPRLARPSCLDATISTSPWLSHRAVSQLQPSRASVGPIANRSSTATPAVTRQRLAYRQAPFNSQLQPSLASVGPIDKRPSTANPSRHALASGLYRQAPASPRARPRQPQTAKRQPSPSRVNIGSYSILKCRMCPSSRQRAR